MSSIFLHGFSLKNSMTSCSSHKVFVTEDGVEATQRQVEIVHRLNGDLSLLMFL